MELCLIQSLPFFSTDAIPEGGLEIEPGFRIGDDRNLLDAFIEKYLFKGQAGKLELDFLRQHPHFAYDLRRTPDPEVPVEIGFGFAHRLVIRSQTFLIALWLVKDNGCNAGTAFLCAKNDDGTLQYLSDRWNVVFTTTQGRTPVTSFNKDELDRAIRLYRDLDVLIPKVAHKMDEPRPTSLAHGSRIGRALFFVQIGRSATDVALKAANYGMAFESLFSSAKTEVAHRISERAALFIAPPGQERRDTYKAIYDLYDCRSTVVHGYPIKEKDLEDLFELVNHCDAHLRQALIKILEDAQLRELFSKHDPEGLSRHFFDRLFPVDPPPAPPAAVEPEAS